MREYHGSSILYRLNNVCFLFYLNSGDRYGICKLRTLVKDLLFCQKNHIFQRTKILYNEQNFDEVNVGKTINAAELQIICIFLTSM